MELILCECGRRVSGAGRDEVVAAMRAHLVLEHPLIAGAAGDDDLAAMIEPEDAPAPEPA